LATQEFIAKKRLAYHGKRRVKVRKKRLLKRKRLRDRANSVSVTSGGQGRGSNLARRKFFQGKKFRPLPRYAWPRYFGVPNRERSRRGI